MRSHLWARHALILVGLLVSTAHMGCVANINPALMEGEGGTSSGGGANGAGGGSAGGTDDPTTTQPGEDATDGPRYDFEPVSPESSLRKIKTLILGTVATEDELAQSSDEDKVAGLVDSWMASPSSDQALFDFFMWSFQLSQMTPQQLLTQQKQNHPPVPYEARAMRESMARTALHIVRDGQPFSNVATTTQFMVTPNYLYWLIIVDNQGSKEYESMLDPNFHYTLVDNANIPLERSGNPADPDYMIWSTAPLSTANCNITLNHSFTVDKKTYDGQVDFGLWLHLGGRTYTNAKTPTGAYCQIDHKDNRPRMPDNLRFKWRLVNLRRTKPGERSTPFWDFDKILNGNEIVLRIPRVGYYTTPAFLGQAPSNLNNQARVTINQAMIVGLHQAFDGHDQTMPANTAALVPEHSQPGTSCYACHITMDPMRQFFRQVIDEDGHVQEDSKLKQIPGVWAWDGVSDVGTDIADFGQHIIKSPRFPLAWVQKVCTWINSVPCDETDPEILLIAGEFKDSGFDFIKMFKRVLTSKVTTYRTVSQSAQSMNTIFTLTRRTQLCNLLSARLKYNDICGLQADTLLPFNLSQFATIMGQYPRDAYTRGSVGPNMATTPSVPVRMSFEFGCGYIAKEFIDAGANTRWRSSSPTTAFADFATQLMGISTSSSQPVVDLLAKHFADARASGLSATDALRSSFVVACTSPYVANIGVY